MLVEQIGVPVPMDPAPPPVGEPRPEEKGKRFLVAGGPWGPAYPLGMMPLSMETEEEDPNP